MASQKNKKKLKKFRLFKSALFALKMGKTSPSTIVFKVRELPSWRLVIIQHITYYMSPLLIPTHYYSIELLQEIML